MSSYFKDKYNQLPSNYPPPSLNSILWLRERLRYPDKLFLPRNSTDIKVGKLYWTMYAFKTGEKSLAYCPLLPVEIGLTSIGPVIWAIQLNFIPYHMRYQVGDVLTKSVSDTLWAYEDMQNPTVLKETKLKISYAEATTILKSAGLWWTVRQFPLYGPSGESLFKKAYEVSWRYIAYMFAMNIGILTGITDEVIVKIWKSKQKEMHLADKRIVEQMQKDGLQNSQIAKYWAETHPVNGIHPNEEKILQDIESKLGIRL